MTTPQIGGGVSSGGLARWFSGLAGMFVAWSVLLAGAWPTALLAQPKPAQHAAPDITAAPHPEEVLRAVRVLRRWLASGEMDARAESALPVAAGAAVVIRQYGQVIGRGQQLEVGGLVEPGASTIRRAFSEAFDQARRHLAMLPVEGVPPGVPAEGLPLASPEQIRSVASTLTLSVELAGAPVPIEPAEITDLDQLLAFGVEGVAVRLGTGVFHAAFPSAMFSGQQWPSDSVRALVARVTGQAAAALERPAVLADRFNLTFYRFRATHAAQVAAGEEPRLLFRGSRIVAVTEVDSPEHLCRWGRSIASHLVRRLAMTPPESSDTEAQAGLLLAAYALAGSAPLDTDASARTAVARAVRAVVNRYPPDVLETADLSVVALFARLAAEIARAADPTMPAASPDSVRVANQRLAAWIEAGPDRQDESPVRRAIILWGWGASAMKDDPARYRRAVRKLLDEVPRERLAGTLPWLGWAALETAGLDEGGSAAYAAVLREARRVIADHQLTAMDAGVDGVDLVGGIVFTAARNPLPSWSTARVTPLLAGMLKHPSFTPESERTAELVRLIGCLRFLRQLTADEVLGWCVVDPTPMLGGVRAATWDLRQPIEASAFTLLTIKATIEAITAWRTSQEKP
jgi:hypothetical protein